MGPLKKPWEEGVLSSTSDGQPLPTQTIKCFIKAGEPLLCSGRQSPRAGVNTVFCQGPRGWVVPVEWGTGWVCDYQIDKVEPEQSR